MDVDILPPIAEAYTSMLKNVIGSPVFESLSGISANKLAMLMDSQPVGFKQTAIKALQQNRPQAFTVGLNWLKDGAIYFLSDEDIPVLIEIANAYPKGDLSRLLEHVLHRPIPEIGWKAWWATQKNYSILSNTLLFLDTPGVNDEEALFAVRQLNLDYVSENDTGRVFEALTRVVLSWNAHFAIRQQALLALSTKRTASNKQLSSKFAKLLLDLLKDPELKQTALRMIGSNVTVSTSSLQDELRNIVMDNSQDFGLQADAAYLLSELPIKDDGLPPLLLHSALRSRGELERVKSTLHGRPTKNPRSISLNVENIKSVDVGQWKLLPTLSQEMFNISLNSVVSLRRFSLNEGYVEPHNLYIVIDISLSRAYNATLINGYTLTDVTAGAHAIVSRDSPVAVKTDVEVRPWYKKLPKDKDDTSELRIKLNGETGFIGELSLIRGYLVITHAKKEANISWEWSSTGIQTPSSNQLRELGFETSSVDNRRLRIKTLKNKASNIGSLLLLGSAHEEVSWSLVGQFVENDMLIVDLLLDRPFTAGTININVFSNLEMVRVPIQLRDARLEDKAVKPPRPDDF